MGATNFECTGEGATVSDAYNAAHDDATHMYGHGGYTGTLAEKGGCVEFPVGDSTADDVHDMLQIDQLDALTLVVGDLVAKQMLSTYDDKWGPAVALPSGEKQWLFCGMAST